MVRISDVSSEGEGLIGRMVGRTVKVKSLSTISLILLQRSTYQGCFVRNQGMGRGIGGRIPEEIRPAALMVIFEKGEQLGGR